MPLIARLWKKFYRIKIQKDMEMFFVSDNFCRMKKVNGFDN